MSERFMRAKMTVIGVDRSINQDRVKMSPVVSNGDTLEDNSYSKYTPSGSLELSITNPDLVGNIEPGQQFYVDFIKVPPKRKPE